MFKRANIARDLELIEGMQANDQVETYDQNGGIRWCHATYYRYGVVRFCQRLSCSSLSFC